ncbi:MAG: hypothetical protein ACKO01_10575 [Erythrobacter sp.]
MLDSYIVPRGFRGWTQFTVWLALIAPLVLWFLDHLLTDRNPSEFWSGVLIFVCAAALWLVGGLWWALARAELVYVVEIRRCKQYERLESERERRRQARAAGESARLD